MRASILLAVLSLLLISTAYAQTNKLEFKPYGYFKLDMAYDTARTNSGNYVFWVNSTGKDGEFNMTARQTRLGGNLSFTELNDKKVTANFEIDFYGGGAENKNTMMMRHAYLKVDFENYYILAGQTSDVVSPLVPTTVNYTVLWNCGNVGYRHPQLQIGNNATRGLQIIGALSRNIENNFDADKDSSLPSLQARLSYITSALNVGISGHYGKSEYINDEGDNKNYKSYSLNIHGNYAVTNAILVKGELFTGRTLDQYLGGVGQGFIEEKEVESSGGWINSVLKVGNNTSYGIGLGIDQPNKDNIKDPLNRSSNRCIFTNVFTKIAHNTTFALELSHWTTGYFNAVGEKDKSNIRAHTALILNF
ncbi:MAG: hypothetical protein HOC71_06450 [Candidatus Latescibacteria bacterium]|nr:hypothetical protein [Candidatus Latescibacterota bacterium]